MALRKPTVMISGQLQDLPAADSISVATVQTDVVSLTNGEATPIVIGAPVYSFAASSVKKAQANGAVTMDVIGIVYDVSITNAVAGNIATDGPVTATTAQWDAVTGQTGGLTPGSTYWLDPATSGKITITAPTTASQYVIKVGKALSTTVLDVFIGTPYLLA